MSLWSNPQPDPKPVLKAALFGWQGAGKTYTSLLVAWCLAELGLCKNKPARVAFIDNENGARWVKPVAMALGLKLETLRVSDFGTLVRACKEAEQEGFDVVIVDSASVAWNELKTSYLDATNESLRRRAQPTKSALEVRHWDPIKRTWRQFTSWIVQAPLHVLSCGRAADEFESSTNSEGSMELRRVGSKLSAEKEFGYEFDLLLELTCVQGSARDKARRVDTPTQARFLSVVKDRSQLLGGIVFELPIAGKAIDHARALLSVLGEMLVTLAPSGTAQFEASKGLGTFAALPAQQELEQLRPAVLSEIQELLAEGIPGGRAAASQELKRAAIMDAIGVRSWKAVQTLSMPQLVDLAGKLSAQFSLPCGDVVERARELVAEAMAAGTSVEELDLPF